MTQIYIFILRAIMGAVIAVVIARTLRPGAGILFVVILAIFLIGMAYVLDYYRKRGN